MKNLIKKLTTKPKTLSFLTTMFLTMLLFSCSSRNFKYGTIMQMIDRGKILEEGHIITDEYTSLAINLGMQISLFLVSLIFIALIIIKAIYNNNNIKLFGIVIGILALLILPMNMYMTIAYLILSAIFYILSELPEYDKIANFIMQLKDKPEMKTYTIEIDRGTLESTITSSDEEDELTNPFTSDYEVTNEDYEVTKVHENLHQKVKEVAPEILDTPKRTRTKRFTVQNARIGDKLPLEFLNEHRYEYEYKKEFITMDESGTRYVREYKITWDEYGVIDNVKTTLTKR